MLKKFKLISHFFHPHPQKLDLHFSPFVMTMGQTVLQVMQASDNDIPALMQLEKMVYSGRTPWSRFSFATELRKKRNSLYLVVYQASTLVAFIGARFYPCETHITNIAVNPSFQGRHIGKRLLQLMINRARRNDNDYVSLEVKVNNQVAKHLYRSLGFKGTFIRKDYYVDTHTDALNMVLWLKPHSVKRKKLISW